MCMYLGGPWCRRIGELASEMIFVVFDIFLGLYLGG